MYYYTIRTARVWWQRTHDSVSYGEIIYVTHVVVVYITTYTMLSLVHQQVDVITDLHQPP